MDISPMFAQTLIRKAFGQPAPFNGNVQGIASNSKVVQPGDLFVAIPCDAEKEHIQEAIQNGAVGIVHEGVIDSSPLPVIHVSNARLALAHLCDCFYPQRPQKLLAVTGTNGKSSVVSLASQILDHIGIPSANIGTLGVHLVSQEKVQIEAPSLTTYDPISLHRILEKLVHYGTQCAVIEATSHGLDQYRLDGLEFCSVALTNLTQDHLDYHHTMEAYAEAKGRLFSTLAQKDATAILNKNSDFFDFFEGFCKKRPLKMITYSFNQSADLTVQDIFFDYTHSIFSLTGFGKIFQKIRLNVPGSFQIENLLCALGLVLGAYPEITLDELIPIIPKLQPITGRFEPIAEYQEGHIFVDFCHTPDALEKALKNLRQLGLKRLCVVFGCGGDRDPGKRVKMGAIAAQLADRTIITDDNPRNEDPALIRRAILQGAPKAEEIAGRENAITQAIAEMHKGDILLIAGRGHEAFQILKDGAKVVCNDKDIILQAIHHFRHL